MSDEDYLVMRAKMAQKNDDAEAKAWLITARTLFPKNFKIQVSIACSWVCLLSHAEDGLLELRK